MSVTVVKRWATQEIVQCSRHFHLCFLFEPVKINMGRHPFIQHDFQWTLHQSEKIWFSLRLLFLNVNLDERQLKKTHSSCALLQLLHYSTHASMCVLHLGMWQWSRSNETANWAEKTLIPFPFRATCVSASTKYLSILKMNSVPTVQPSKYVLINKLYSLITLAKCSRIKGMTMISWWI